MCTQEPERYHMHSQVVEAMDSVYAWLDSRPEAKNYRKRDIDLDRADLKQAAVQFYRLFPTHYFKVLHTLWCLIGPAIVSGWLSDGGHLCVVDIGCGGGAGSAALIDVALRLCDQGHLRGTAHILCVGVDPSEGALAVYDHLMQGLEAQVPGDALRIEHTLVDESIPGATDTVQRVLSGACQQWRLPCLPHALVVQANVVRPFLSGLRARREVWKELEQLGVDRESFLSDQSDEFGLQEALTYADLMKMVPIDHMHVLTVATTDKKEYEPLVGLMDRAMGEVFRIVGELSTAVKQGTHRVDFVNPPRSYHGKHQDNGSTEFNVVASAVTSAEWAKDAKWHNVVARENLRLAWARVRNYLMRESLFDEVEIRLFDARLDENLDRLRRQLFAYAQEAMRHQDRLAYSFPKSLDETRPRCLSRME